jgi:phosphate transport system ATP-binding protein
MMETKVAVRDLSLWYGKSQALYNVNMDVYKNKVSSIIGPSGCGKSTLIRCLNRMNDYVDSCKIKGHVWIDKEDIYSRKVDQVNLRRKVGMVFQKPNPFPFSVYDNIAYGLRMAGIKKKKILDQVVETSLVKSGLWEELGDRLGDNAEDLSGGQQQRLCIARALAMGPEILLMDEPCSALDPISTQIIEDLIKELKREFTVAIVTHNMEQAARVSDYTTFIHLGKIVETDNTKKLFTDPKDERTMRYIEGKFG